MEQTIYKQGPIEAKIQFPDGKDTVHFDMDKLTDLLIVNPTKAVNRAELNDMYYQSFALDEDHIAYVSIPQSFFKDDEKNVKKTSKKSTKDKKRQ